MNIILINYGNNLSSLLSLNRITRIFPSSFETYALLITTHILRLLFPSTNNLLLGTSQNYKESMAKFEVCHFRKFYLHRVILFANLSESNDMRFYFTITAFSVCILVTIMYLHTYIQLYM